MQVVPPRSQRLPPLDSPRVGSPRVGSPRVGSPRVGSPRILSPRVHRQRPTTSSAQVRGGGRLFAQSPLSGYTEAEMVREAQIRLEHNRQRQRLKHLLETASNGASMVKMNELLLACKLAKMPMDANRIVSTPDVGMRLNRQGEPQAVAWKEFHRTLDPPNLHGHGAFGELPQTRMQRRGLGLVSAQSGRGEGHESNSISVAPGEGTANGTSRASDEEVYKHWVTLKRLMDTRFTELRKAFRLIDEDSSGTCERDELKFMLNAMFNLTIPENVMDRLIDLADYDGDGVINFAEFARIMTTDNVLNMKHTLVADVSGWGVKNPGDPNIREEVDFGALAARNRKDASGHVEGGHAKLRRTGPGLASIRRAHQIYKKGIMARHLSWKEAFNAIDTDGSGKIRRNELRRYLSGLSKSIDARTVSALIDFCDKDGDAKTLDLHEFVNMMEAETLGGPDGYDPQHQRSVPRASDGYLG